MKRNGICRRVIGVLFVVLLSITGSFSINSLSTKEESNVTKNQAVFATNSKDQKAKSLYYKYYMILKARNKMHKV